MTVPGSKRVNATGRTDGKRKDNRRTKISGQFAPRLIDMLRSPAYRALNLAEHRVLSRLEIELADHGGADNGALACTFDDFSRYGVRRDSIAPAIAALEALGFIEITERGRAGNATWRRPSLYRLTHRPTAAMGPTEEWRRIQTDEKANTVAKGARASVTKRDYKKTKPQSTKRDLTSVTKRDSSERGCGHVSRTTAHGHETGPLSISRGGAALQRSAAQSDSTVSRHDAVLPDLMPKSAIAAASADQVKAQLLIIDCQMDALRSELRSADQLTGEQDLWLLEVHDLMLAIGKCSKTWTGDPWLVEHIRQEARRFAGIAARLRDGEGDPELEHGPEPQPARKPQPSEKPYLDRLDDGRPFAPRRSESDRDAQIFVLRALDGVPGWEGFGTKPSDWPGLPQIKQMRERYGDQAVGCAITHYASARARTFSLHPIAKAITKAQNLSPPINPKGTSR